MFTSKCALSRLGLLLFIFLVVIGLLHMASPMLASISDTPVEALPCEGGITSCDQVLDHMLLTALWVTCTNIFAAWSALQEPVCKEGQSIRPPACEPQLVNLCI